MEKNPYESAVLEDFIQTISAINDETRVKILKFIAEHGPLCVCDLEKSFNMLQSRLSRHLKILKDAGYLSVKRVGKWGYYSIRTPIDRFRLQAIEEIKTLPIELPKLNRVSSSCEI